MGTWRLELFLLFQLTVCSGITTNIQSSYSNTWNLLIRKKSSQPMYPTTSAVGNLLVNIIPTVAVRTDPASFPDITVSSNRASNKESVASKIHMSGGDRDKSNASMVCKNGDIVANDVSSLNVNGNFTVFPNSSRLNLNDTTINVRNTGNTGNNNDVVYITVRFGIFFGGIFFILLAGIGIYKARTRCRPEKYEDPLTV